MPMANRIVLQMDQAASPHQGLLRNFRKCGKDPNLDCRLHLCPCRHHSKTSPSGAESLHNFADLERYSIRKSATESTICKLRLQKFRGIQRTTVQTTKFVQLLTGHYCLLSNNFFMIAEDVDPYLLPAHFQHLLQGIIL